MTKGLTDSNRLEIILTKAVKGAPQNQGARQEFRVPASKPLIQRVSELRHSTAAGAVDPQTASKGAEGVKQNYLVKCPLGRSAKPKGPAKAEQ